MASKTRTVRKPGKGLKGSWRNNGTTKVVTILGIPNLSFKCSMAHESE